MIKKTISILTVLLIIFATTLIIPVSAAETNLQFSAHSVEVGKKFVVTISFAPHTSMLGLKTNVMYNANVLKFETYEFLKGDGVVNATQAAGTLPVVFSTLSPKSVFSIRLTFTTIATGESSIAVKDCIYTYQPSPEQQSKEVTFNGQSAKMTVIDKQLPNNANLSSLSLSAGALSPNFTAARTNYTASVPFETDKITLYAKTSDAKAKVAISSNPANLNVGANTIKVTVTAQNGSQKIYTVVVTRREQGATSEPPVTSTPDTPANPFETVISGKNYEIVTTLPETATLQGFTSTTVEYNGAQVPVLRDKDNVYTVYYLREQGTTEAAPYLYNSELETFEVLKYQTFNNRLYIFSDFPSDVTMPSDYYSTYSQIGNHSVKVYLSSNTSLSDFAYVYCYANGDFGLYRYDSKEETIQRYPDIHLVDAPVNTTPKKDNFMTRFASLSTNGKVLLIAMLIAALCVVILIIFIFVMAFRKLSGPKNFIADDDDFSFDDVTIVGENDIFSNKK